MENIRILFAGDFCIRGRNRQFLTDEKIAELSQSVRTVTKNYDLSVVNIETVFKDTPTPTKKSGPNICSPTKALELLKGFGFTLGAFANNHSMDQGAEAAIVLNGKN